MLFHLFHLRIFNRNAEKPIILQYSPQSHESLSVNPSFTFCPSFPAYARSAQPFLLMNGIHLAPWVMSFYNASWRLINWGLICAHAKTNQAETITSVINWCWSGHGDGNQKPAGFYLFIYFPPVEDSSAEQSISVQSLLFSEVIKQGIDLLAGDSYLLPFSSCSRLRFLIGCLGREISGLNKSWSPTLQWRRISSVFKILNSSQKHWVKCFWSEQWRNFTFFEYLHGCYFKRNCSIMVSQYNLIDAAILTLSA